MCLILLCAGCGLGDTHARPSAAKWSLTRACLFLLCAGCGLGDTCYRLVYAKWSLTPLWLKKRNGFDTLCLPDTSRGQKSIFGKNIHMLGRGCTFCFVTFQIHLSSQNVYVNDLGMTGPIFRVPGQNEFAKVEI